MVLFVFVVFIVFVFSGGFYDFDFELVFLVEVGLLGFDVYEMVLFLFVLFLGMMGLLYVLVCFYMSLIGVLV